VVKVTAERLPDAQVVLNIEVEPEAVAKATDRAFQSLANRMNVPGFRRGKAPRYLIERMIGGPEALRQEGIERVIPEVYREAVEQSGVEPIDQPELEVVSVDPLVVKATISVQPEVELGDYKSIRVPRLPVEVPYERINETIERLREQQTRWEPVERAAQAGDRVTSDVTATVGAAPTLYDTAGQPLLSTEGRETLIDQKNAEFELDPESQSPVPGFHKELVGLAPKAEKRFVVSLPADWPNEAQRGQSVLFHVQLHEVKEPKVPALDDEFAKAVGEYETLDVLREDVRNRLREQLEHEAEHQYQDSVLAEAVARSNVVLPPALLRRETERLVRNFEQNLARQRLSLDQYLKLTDKTREGLADELRPTAERNLKNYLVLREVAQAETVAVTEEEIEAEIDRVAASMSDEGEAARVREMLNSQSQRDDLQASIWERKVTQLLIGIAQQPPEAAGTAVDATDTAPADEEQAGDEATEKPKRSRAKKPTQKD
jgi:trigger factor